VLLGDKTLWLLSIARDRDTGEPNFFATVSYLVELSDFHVTFQIGLERIHFYYHERSENAWKAAGHTSGREIRRLGVEPAQLRAQADMAAALFIAAVGGVYHPRRGSGVRDETGPTG